jgi:hypothetical protein
MNLIKSFYEFKKKLKTKENYFLKNKLKKLKKR